MALLRFSRRALPHVSAIQALRYCESCSVGAGPCQAVTGTQRACGRETRVRVGTRQWRQVGNLGFKVLGLMVEGVHIVSLARLNPDMSGPPSSLEGR